MLTPNIAKTITLPFERPPAQRSKLQGKCHLKVSLRVMVLPVALDPCNLRFEMRLAVAVRGKSVWDYIDCGGMGIEEIQIEMGRTTK